MVPLGRTMTWVAAKDKIVEVTIKSEKAISRKKHLRLSDDPHSRRNWKVNMGS